MADVKMYLVDREERARRFRRSLRIAIAITLFLCIIGFIWWFVFRSPVFAVRDVLVAGNERVRTSDVQSVVIEAVQKSSLLSRFFGLEYLWAWPSGAMNDALASLPVVKTLHIEKDYAAHQVKIVVEEREPYGIWCFRKSAPAACFWFEMDGTLFASAPDAEGGLIRVVSDSARDALALRDTVLPADFMENLRTVFAALHAASVVLREVRYEDPALQEVRVVTRDGPQLLFSLRFSAESTITVIKDLMTNGGKNATGKGPVPFGKLEYVDFRVENRAYYK